MKAGFLALAVVAAGLAGCATDYVPTRPVNKPGPEYSDREIIDRPGMFGELRWNIDPLGRYQPVRPSEEEEFKRWKALENNPERREFEEWRAWQEWKRKNPK